MQAFLRSLFVGLVVATAGGCSVAADADRETDVEDDTEAMQEAVSACGKAKYDAALASYKRAVAWSKDRLAKGVCNSEWGMQWTIADEASRAVMTCGELRKVIRTSRWAEPLRTVLSNSLTLRSLTGELLVIRDSSWQNWTGVDAFFGRGLSFWARAEGAYGPAVRIDFAASGKATWGEVYHDDKTFNVEWRTSPATWTIVKTSERGLRTVKVTNRGKTHTFQLRVENPFRPNDAPQFVLDPGTSTSVPKLYSLVSECDA